MNAGRARGGRRRGGDDSLGRSEDDEDDDEDDDAVSGLTNHDDFLPLTVVGVSSKVVFSPSFLVDGTKKNQQVFHLSIYVLFPTFFFAFQLKNTFLR